MWGGAINFEISASLSGIRCGRPQITKEGKLHHPWEWSSTLLNTLRPSQRKKAKTYKKEEKEVGREEFAGRGARFDEKSKNKILTRGSEERTWTGWGKILNPSRNQK